MCPNDQRLFDQKVVDVALENAVSYLMFIRLRSLLDLIIRKENNNIKKRHLKELQELRQRKIREGSRPALFDPVTDLFSHILMDEGRAALANGLHPVYPPEHFDQVQFVCNIKIFLCSIIEHPYRYQHHELQSADVVVHHELRSTHLHAASQLRCMANTTRRAAQLEMKKGGKNHRFTFEVLRSLAEDRSVIITRPDNGR